MTKIKHTYDIKGEEIFPATLHEAYNKPLSNDVCVLEAVMSNPVVGALVKPVEDEIGIVYDIYGKVTGYEGDTKVYNVTFGEVYRVKNLPTSYVQGVSIISLWKDDKFECVCINTDVKRKEYVLSIPNGVNKLKLLGGFSELYKLNNEKSTTDYESIFSSFNACAREIFKSAKLTLVSSNLESKKAYQYDGTISKYSNVVDTSVIEVKPGEIYKIPSNTKSYEPGMACISLWKDNVFEILIQRTGLQIPFDYYYICIPEGINKIKYLGTKAYRVEFEQLDNKDIIQEINNNTVPTDNRNLFIGERQRVDRKFVDYRGYVGQSNTLWCYKIRLEPNTKYYVYKTNKGGFWWYNFVVTNESEETYTGYNVSDGNNRIGAAISIEDGKYTFTTPNSNEPIYLFANLYLGATLPSDAPRSANVSNRFFVTTDANYNSGQSFIINGVLYTEDIDKLLKEVSLLKGGFDKDDIFILGDSITWYGNDSCSGLRGWTKYFKDILKPRTCRSFARSGATWTNTVNTKFNTTENTEQTTDDNTIYNQVNRIEIYSKDKSVIPSIIIIAAGTNDCWFPDKRPDVLNETAKDVFSQAGQIVSQAPNEIRSMPRAIRYNCEKLINLFPDVQIIILTPLQSTGFTLERLADVKQSMLDSCTYMAIPTIEQDKIMQVSRQREMHEKKYTSDGTHLVAFGAQKVGEKIAGFTKMLLGH